MVTKPRAKRRTPEEIFTAAAEKVERARVRQAFRLSIGEQRRSLTALPSLAGLSHLRDLSLSFTGVTDLSPLLDIKWLEALDLRGCPVWDISVLSELKSLRFLNLSLTNVREVDSLTNLDDLEFIDISGTKIQSLSLLSNCNLKHLIAYSSLIEEVKIFGLTNLDLDNCPITDAKFLEKMPLLEQLSLSGTKVHDFRPISKLKNLRELEINRSSVDSLEFAESLEELRTLSIISTPVTSLAPVANLRELQHLNISRTNINDLSPLSYNTSLPKAAKRYERRYGNGITCYGCKFSNSDIDKASHQENPDRTYGIFNALRRSVGLPPLDLNENDELDDTVTDPLRPIDQIPSTFSFGNSPSGKIIIAANPADFPIFPGKQNETEHADRLDVCRMLADDLIQELEDRSFQVRIDYLSSLKKYIDRLPTSEKKKNILLADAEARIIRNLFSSDAKILPAPFASRLKTLLEYHIGLRVFYPEITKFYRDVQHGRLISPLPLDAIEGFVRVVEENVPEIFDPKVQDAIEGTAVISDENIPVEAYPLGDLDEPSNDGDEIQPPRDPLGELDVQRSWDFTVAGVGNGLWKAFLEGERVNKTASNWIAAGQSLRPYAKSVVDWLKEFMGTPTS